MNIVSRLYGVVVVKGLPEGALTGIRLSPLIYLELREEQSSNDEGDILKLFGLQVTVDPYLKGNEIVFECRAKVEMK